MPDLAHRLLIATLCGAPACTGGGGGTGDADLCAASDAPTLTVGQGVGGSFVPYAEGEDVILTAAPQGGFGVVALIQTQGLVAGDGAYVGLSFDLELNDANLGTFFVPQLPLLCRDEGFGGLLSGVMAGLDPDMYQSNDDLLALDGAVVDIVAFVTDETASTATVRHPVTIRVGG